MNTLSLTAGILPFIIVATTLGALEAHSDDLDITFYGQQTSQNSYSAYREGFALVRDERDILFEEGRSSIVLPGVSSGIDPATVTFHAEGIQIVEQNFDFDLLTPGKLLEKSVGETVEIVRVNPASGEETREQVTILAANEGAVLEVDGKIEVLRADSLPTRVIYEKVPENLRSSPTLSVDVITETRGERPARLTYLSGGLSWRGWSAPLRWSTGFVSPAVST